MRIPSNNGIITLRGINAMNDLGMMISSKKTKQEIRIAYIYSRFSSRIVTRLFGLGSLLCKMDAMKKLLNGLNYQLNRNLHYHLKDSQLAYYFIKFLHFFITPFSQKYSVLSIILLLI